MGWHITSPEHRHEDRVAGGENTKVVRSGLRQKTGYLLSCCQPFEIQIQLLGAEVPLLAQLGHHVLTYQ
jgi:hypothetical protein